MSDHLADTLLQRDDRSIELLYFGQTRKDDFITHGGLSSLFIELSDLGHELGLLFHLLMHRSMRFGPIKREGSPALEKMTLGRVPCTYWYMQYT